MSNARCPHARAKRGPVVAKVSYDAPLSDDIDLK
jgi:hypothetical protein